MRSNSVIRFFFASFVSVITLAGIGVSYASAAPQNHIQSRITQAVSNESVAPIPNSVHPRARLATDLGPTQADTKLTGMTLRFTPSATQQAALDQLLLDLQNPASPSFHQWLTPQQYGAQFGLSTSDLAKVTSWLTSQGFAVTGVAQGGTFVSFDGTVAQAQATFSTSIHNLTVNGEVHFANVTNASVPSALTDVVADITGLHNFRPTPRLHTILAKPAFTSSVSGSHYLAPGDLYTIYNVNPLLNNAINGTGVSIAVIGQVQIYAADVAAFRSASGLSSTNLPTSVAEGGGASTANNCDPSSSTNCSSPNLLDLAESSLDVEWSGAMAPAAVILYVNGPDVFNNSMTQAIDQNLAPIITASYGLCETGWGSTYINSMNQLFQQANAQGQTILAASGDAGATDCDSGPSAVYGLAVDFPASSPYVTAMGGTQLNEGNTTGTTQYWNANSSSSSANSGSALSYIPEAVWNDYSQGTFGAGGGGISAFFAKPAWQIETGATGMTTQVTPDTKRDVPDISLVGSNAHDPLLYCANNSCVVGFRATTNGNLTASGGTSFDSQIFGGMLALIEQKIGSRIGNANPTLYSLGNNAAYYSTASSSVFHDVTVGDNAMPCTQGKVNCPSGGTIGYSAGTGYDLATGWGTVDLNNLANAWNVVSTVVPGFSVTSSAPLVNGVHTISVAAGGSIPTVTITLTPLNGFSGTVAFTSIVSATTSYAAGITFSPTSVTVPSGSTASVSTTLTLSGIVASLHMPNVPGQSETRILAQHNTTRGPWYAAGSGVTLASLLLLILPRKRRLGGLFMVLLSVVLVAGASGCGNGQTTPSPSSSTSTNKYIGTYQVTVIATYTGAGLQVPVQSTVISFAIQ